MNPLFLSDSYKQSHFKMYPEGMDFLFSNFTARKSRIEGVENTVCFGIQYLCKEYLIKRWNEHFFDRPKHEVIEEYKKYIKPFAGDISTTHIEALHDLGFLPIEIRSVKEGELVPIRVPTFVVFNTHKQFAWLTNFLESLISNVVWSLITSATKSYNLKKILDSYNKKTTGSVEFTKFQLHDFAMRGYSSVETSYARGAGHLLSCVGTDNIPASQFLYKYYNVKDDELVGCSVPATEHSVMTSYGKENEINAFDRLLNIYPEGILSIVSDSFDLWKVCTEYVVKLKEKILSRNGKIVIRPDSGDPVDIVCGKDSENINERKGVIELLWDVFGGKVNELGYKELDSHIGVIYGDSITVDRAVQISEKLIKKGFATTNIVYGIGSFFQLDTRDTFGFAMKSTYCEINGEPREIYKDPITDDGTKKSAKGLLAVYNKDGKYIMKDQVSREEFNTCDLIPVFRNSKVLYETSLSEIRNKLGFV